MSKGQNKIFKKGRHISQHRRSSKKMQRYSDSFRHILIRSCFLYYTSLFVGSRKNAFPDYQFSDVQIISSRHRSYFACLSTDFDEEINITMLNAEQAKQL